MILAAMLLLALPTKAERVTPETARKVATTFLSNNGIKNNQLTDLTEAAGFTNLYIFNANQGFVVMAADDCAQPILGYSLKGRFVVESMPTNVSGWLQGYNDEIQYAIDNRMSASAETAKLWKDLAEGNAKAGKATIVVDALIQSTWDQDPGYNDLCPYDSNAGELTVTGCVATAMAQIMRYWEYPSHGLSSHSYTPSTHPEYGVQSVNFAQATYDWTAMPLYSSSDEIAKLMYHCGVSVDMDYDIGANGGSGAYNSAIPTAFKTYFNYKTTASLKSTTSPTGTSWMNQLKTELNAGRPVEYNGSGNGGGHAFVCDGYDNSNYFHFNWGWSGANDGFYSLSSLVPGSGGSGGGSYNFTQNQSAVIGIQPKSCTASSPTNLSIDINNRTAVLTWGSANNAVSYSIYRNGLLIANTNNTTYSDIDLSYGTYAYYAKSVDSNGAKSSPTSTVTATIEPTASNLTVTKNGNNAILSWTEPEWVVPASDNEVLTYGDGSLTYHFGGGGGTNYYFGHKYLASMINANKVLYKVSFYATMTGAFKLYVYTATAGNSKPQTQVFNQSITVSATGWNDIILSSPLQLNSSKDLWVFIFDPEGKSYPIGAGVYEGSDNYGNYIATNPTSNPTPQEGIVMLIRTCIADGSFFYNLYDGNTTVASNISGTSHTLSSISNNTAHQYTLKTNFNGGLTGASNMAGLTIGNASINTLAMTANDKMTITEGSKLTVSGTLSDVNADNLILENGAQLVNGSNNVQATVKKNITAYSSDEDGWYFIASPVTENITPSVANGLLANNYDLYLFNQSEDLEWRNIEAGAFSAISHKTGYLYANSGNPTLTFAGTLAATTEATTLAYDGSASYKGFNLIGNPYPCNTTINKDFYIISNNVVTLAETNAVIAPCEGVFVKATSAGQSVTFTKAAAKGKAAQDCFDIVVMKDKATLDRARVRFGEGIGMEKYNLDDKHSQISLWQDGQSFAVAFVNEKNEIPLDFKAVEDGTYTLNIELGNNDMEYLHLIDNLTGNDVDLLVSPSYTFEATISDYPSRFRLVLSNCEDAVGGNEPFAFISNGNIIVHQEGTLQIVDMTGRVVMLGNAMNRISTNEMATGVYVLRLITANGVKTQKMVIE